MTPHLTREDLQRFWDGAPADRGRVVEHLARCDECGSLYGEVVDAATPMPEHPVEVDPTLVERAYDAYTSSGATPAFPRAAWLAAAAALIAAIAIPILRSPGGTPADADDAAVRGSALQPLTPVGLVSEPVRFAWSSPMRATRYRVDVRDASDRLVLQLWSTTDSVPLEASHRARLQPGEPYHWWAVALDNADEEMLSTPPVTFILAASTP